MHWRPCTGDRGCCAALLRGLYDRIHRPNADDSEVWPEAASKERRIDPLESGCACADGVLLPLMRRLGRFVDQEAFGSGA